MLPFVRWMASAAFGAGLVLSACHDQPATNADRGDGGGADLGAGEARPDASLALAVFDGIYTVDEVTLNASGCAAEGPSVKANEPALRFIAVAVNVAVNFDQVTLAGCTDAADCRSVATMARALRVSGVPWLFGVTGTGPDNGTDTVRATSPTNGMCIGETIEHATLTGTPRGTLRIEVRIIDVPTHPARGGTSCDPMDTSAGAAGLPCSRLKVITGTYEQAL